MPGFTRENLLWFCAVSSSRWASTQALASAWAINSPAVPERQMVLPAPVGATPSVLPWVLSAPTQRVTLCRGEDADLAVELTGALLDDVGGGDAGFTLRPAGADALRADARAAELLRAIHALAAELGGSPLPDLLREAQALTQQHFVRTALDRHPGDAPAAARLLGISIEEMARLRRQPGFTAPPPTR